MKLLTSTVTGIFLMINSLVASAYSVTDVNIKNNDYSSKNTPVECNLYIGYTSGGEIWVATSGTLPTGSSKLVRLPHIEAGSKEYIDVLCLQNDPTRAATLTSTSICGLPGNNSCKLASNEDYNQLAVTIPQGFFQGSAAK